MEQAEDKFLVCKVCGEDNTATDNLVFGCWGCGKQLANEVNGVKYLNVSNFSKELQDFYKSVVNDKNEYVHAFGVILIDFEPMQIFNDKLK